MMKNDSTQEGTLGKYLDRQTDILRRCNIQYWTFYPDTNSCVSGLNAMSQLGYSKAWADFPQKLVDMGLIHKVSVKNWLQMHEDIKQCKQDITNEILVVENGLPIWKKIQYHTEFDENGKPESAIGIAENISNYKSLAEDYAQAAKQCNVTMWMFDLASKTIYDINNSTHMQSFDSSIPIHDVPEVFARSDSALNPMDLQGFYDMFDSIYKGAKTAKSVGRWWDKSCNIWWWYEISYTTIFDIDDKPVKAIGTAVDITERVRLEERYKEEAEWRKMHNQDVIGSYKINLTQNICEDGQSDNPTILTFQGNGTVDDFFMREYATHVYNDELEEYQKTFSRDALLKSYHDGKTSFKKESYVNFGMGKILWIEIEIDMFINPENGDIEAYIYATDIDQKKTAQAMVDAVVTLDYDYLALLDLQNGAYTLFAQSSNKTPLPNSLAVNYELEVERYARSFLMEEDIEQNIKDMSCQNVSAQLEKQTVYTTFCRVREPSGSISRKKLQFSYLDKQRKKVILTRSDITDIYNEEQIKNDALKNALLAAQQASTAKSDFLSRMSHEIRTPMNTIIGMTTLAASCVNDPQQVSEYLSKVGIAARFLLSLINDILDMSRIESGKLLIRHEKISFDEFINSISGICHAQAQQKGVEYDAIITSFTEEEYIGDAMKLQQVIINIASNAIKFTPKGGKVQLIVHQEKTSHDYAILKFTINDTGIGISESFLPHIFEPFEQQRDSSTTPYAGTGLGLAISKNLIDLMNGKITVNSIEGVGSEFVVEVKLGVVNTGEKAINPKLNLQMANLKALIVDDDIIICRHTKQILLDMKMQAEYVDSGAKAIEAVRSKWSRQEYYDIILVDWKMPDMDGIETTRIIRKIVGPDVTIIIMTAYDWASIETPAKLAGVSMLISKPLFKASLCSAFEKIYIANGNRALPMLPKEYDFSGKRVLLVEDHLLNIEVAKKLLNAKHMEVEIAQNGLQAIEIFAQREAGYYDAILMDIRMPVMDGIIAAQSIRQMRKSDAATIPIIAMTANAFEEDVEKTKAVGMDAHLAKPIEPQLLYQTMQHFLFKEE